MVSLHDIVRYLNTSLNISGFKDAPMAFNGLQVENSGSVTRIATAVDGSEQTIQAAIEAGCDLLIVHHGIFWQQMQPVTGIAYRKLKLALEHNLAIYAAHLPLDQHPEYGNNALLSHICGLIPSLPSFSYHGVELGYRGILERSGKEILHDLEQATGTKWQAYWHQSPEQTLGDTVICSGGAGNDITQVAQLGAKTYITGEGSYWTIPLAAELGINLLYGGHYETETFGVKELGTLLSEKFSLPSTFLSLPPQSYSVSNS